MMRFSRPGMTFEWFFADPSRALYALLDAHRFQRAGLRIEAEFVEHRCFRQRGCQYGDVDA